MERLWAPWRMRYVVGPKKPRGECVFCSAAGGDDAAACVLARGPHCFTLLNAYPYNNGHLMVVPYEHVSELTDLALEVQAELLQTAAQWTKVIVESMNAQGFNVGLNLGAAAGAGIADHLHLHVVPRWHGDTNFMPVTGGVRVMPENLDETYERLRAGWVESQGTQ
ncbi:MAG: HIT domain-containing protein [Armatimonadetes bacterium]|nr:HIT domain-containing protein [Armatimonadota bacterium]